VPEEELTFFSKPRSGGTDAGAENACRRLKPAPSSFKRLPRTPVAAATCVLGYHDRRPPGSAVLRNDTDEQENSTALVCVIRGTRR
jgi:hypothetical protein